MEALPLFVGCLDLNKLVIKHRDPLPSVGKSLKRLGRAKQYIELDLTDAYYWIHIKTGGTNGRQLFGLGTATTSTVLYHLVLPMHLLSFSHISTNKGVRHEEAVRWLLGQLPKEV